MARTDGVSDQDRHEIWDCWLDGCSVNYIREYKVSEYSRDVLKAVLDEEPPESIRTDDRYVHNGRFFWIAASGVTSSVTGEELAFVVAKMPNRIGNTAFSRGLKAIARDLVGLYPGARSDIHAIDALEARIALRYVNELGCPGWVLDAKGNIERMVAAPAAEPDGGPASRP